MKKIYPFIFRFRFAVPVFLFLFAVNSCLIQQEVTRLNPEAPEGHMELGREYITLVSDSICTMLGYDGLHDETLIFDLVIVNEGNLPITVDPGSFYYEILDSATAINSELPVIQALPGEQISGKYDRTIEKIRQQQKNNKILGFIEAGTWIFLNTAGLIIDEDPWFIENMFIQTFETANFYISRGEQIENRLNMIVAEKGQVYDATLKGVRLEPDSSIAGFVFFPQKKEAKYYMFCFPIENELFQFVYNQEISYR